jgi:TonB family protein
VRGVPELDKIFAKGPPDTTLAESSTPPAISPAKEDNPAPAQPVKTRKSQKSRSGAALGTLPSAVASEDRRGVTLPSFVDPNSPVMVPAPIPRDAASQNSPSQPSTQTEEPTPPPVNVAASGKDSQPLAGVMENVMSVTPRVEPGVPPPDAPQPRPAAEIVPGKLVSRSQPAYPDEAKRLGIEGTVILHAVITKDGKLKDVRATEGETRLASAAETAVRKWKYTPYTLNGEPVEVDTEIRVKFNLNSK